MRTEDAVVLSSLPAVVEASCARRERSAGCVGDSAVASWTGKKRTAPRVE
jgi:hypothetical protein